MKVLLAIALVGVTFTIFAFQRVFNEKIIPETVRVLNPTNFTSPLEGGAVIFRRYWTEIASSNLVVVASSPLLRDYDAVWMGFLSAAKHMGVNFDVIFTQKTLRQLGQNNIDISWKDINEALNKGNKVLLHVLSDDKILQDLNKKFKKGLFIYQNLLPVDEQSHNLLKSSCDLQSSNFQMNCQALKALSHGKRRTKFDPNKWTAVIEKMPVKGELLLIHEGQL